MKKLSLFLKVIPVLFAGICMFVISSCKVNVEPDPETKKVQTKDDVVLSRAKDSLVIETIVEEDVVKIELPGSSEDVTITWKSDNESVIKSDGTVIHKVRAGEQIVKLIATLRANETSDTKVFEVTVKNPEFTSDEIAVNNAEAKLNIPAALSKDITTIGLPKKIDDVTVTWSSSDSSVINPDLKENNVIHKEGDSSDTITLTAVLKKGEASKTKTFTVEVFQQAVVLSENQIFTVAKDMISVDFTDDTLLTKKAVLKDSVTVDDKIVSVTWSLGDKSPKTINLAGNILTVTSDIIDVNGKITATLSYDGKADTKTFNFIVSQVTNCKYYKNEYAVISGDIIEKDTMRFKMLDVDIDKGTLYLQKYAKKYASDPKWTTIDEEIANKDKEARQITDLFKFVEENPTVENAKIIMFEPDPITDDTVYSVVFNAKTEEELEEARNKPDAEKQAAIKAYVVGIRKNGATNMGLNPETATWDDLAAESARAEKEELEKDKIPIKSKYRFYVNGEGSIIQFEITTAYDTKLNWYENKGCFSNGKEEDYEKIYLIAYTSESDKGKGSLDIRHSFYTVKFNDDYTQFSTVQNTEPARNWNVISTDPSKEQIIVSGTDLSNVILTFKGDPVLYNW